MLTRWTDDRDFSFFDDFRRRMERLMDEPGWVDSRSAFLEPQAPRAEWPRVALRDGGANLVLTAEVPGLAENDIKITVNQDAIAIEGERKSQTPEGHSVHRRERASFKFSRSFALPTRIDPEKSSASVKHGVLTVLLAKHPEAQPRQIAVTAQ